MILSKALSPYQIFMKIHPRPTINALLADTIRHSAEKRLEHEESELASSRTGER